MSFMSYNLIQMILYTRHLTKCQRVILTDYISNNFKILTFLEKQHTIPLCDFANRNKKKNVIDLIYNIVQHVILR